MEELAGLAQYGYPGIVIAMIVLLSVVIYKMFEMNKSYQNLMGDNFKTLNESFNKNTEVLEGNNALMKEVLFTTKNCPYNRK